MCVSSQAWHHAEGEETLFTLMYVNRQIHADAVQKLTSVCVCEDLHFHSKAKNTAYGSLFTGTHTACLGVLFILYLISFSRLNQIFKFYFASIIYLKSHSNFSSSGASSSSGLSLNSTNAACSIII